MLDADALESSPEADVLFASTYTICRTVDDDLSLIFAVEVEWRGDDRWAVTRLGRCYDAEGEGSYEPSPSNREEDWLTTHRFTLPEAIKVARRVLPTITLSGKTFEEWEAESGD